MKHEIEISGCIQTDLNEDDFYDAFITWVEEHSWYFGGGVKEYEPNSQPSSGVSQEIVDKWPTDDEIEEGYNWIEFSTTGHEVWEAAIQWRKQWIISNNQTQK